MQASRITAIGLVAAAALWIVSGHLIPHESAESRAALRPSEADAASLGLLRPCESALALWDNPEDDVWDRVEPTPIT